MERRDKIEGNNGMKGKTKGRKEKRMEGRKKAAPAHNYDIDREREDREREDLNNF